MRGRWLLAILVLILIDSAFAVGIAPAKISLSSSPGETLTVTYHAINDLNYEVIVEPYVSGQLAGYAKIPEKNIYLKPKEMKKFDIVLTMPAGLSLRYESFVGVLSAPSKLNAGLSANVAAESLLEINMVLDRPAMQLNLASEGQAPVVFRLGMKNPTIVSVSNIKGDLEIFDGSLTVLATFDIASDLLESGKTESKKFEWPPPNSGEFIAIANVNFDSGSANAKTKFQVGEKLIEISGVKIAKKGNVVEILTEVENKWNTDLTAWAEVAVLQNETKFDVVKSQTVEVPAGQKATLTAYWEADKNPDDFDFDVVVHYGEFTAQKRISAKPPRASLSSGLPIRSAFSKLSGAFSALKDLRGNKAYAIMASMFIIALLIILFAYSRRQPPQATATRYKSYEDYYKRYYEYLSKQGKK